MPKGYVLDQYYDVMRAVFRKMYSQQIKLLSGTIKEMGYYSNDAYGIIIGSINDGLYNNLGDLFSKSVYGRYNEQIGKSSYGQDFMSPLELRMNAIAVRRAQKEIEASDYISLNAIKDICYSAASSVANEMYYLKRGNNEYDMQVKNPVLSVKPIIKMYDKNLVLGTLPAGKKFDYQSPEQKQEKNRLLYSNIALFAQIKSRLVELGLTEQSDRIMAFGKLNENYYETDAGNSHTLEICKVLIKDKKDEMFSISELSMNYDKLQIALGSLNKLKNPVSKIDVYKCMSNSGKKAREFVVSKNGMIPEMFSGFYNVYIDSDKRLAIKKAMENNVKGDNK